MSNRPLIGQVVSLRAIEPEDLEHLYQWENDTTVWEYAETLSPYSRYILKRYLEEAQKDIYETRQLRMMIQALEEDRTVGTIDLYEFEPHHLRAAVGILIAEKDDRRHGFAGEALELMIGYCREVLQLKQLFCKIAEDNLASIRLFTSKGFQETGRRKAWLKSPHGFRDELFFQLILN